MLGPALCALLLVGAVQASGALDRIENDTVDLRFGLRGTQPAPGEVVLVALDDRSLDLIGERPPIPRAIHARLLDRLRAADPRVIAYDIQFTEPTRSSDDLALYDAVRRARPVVLATSEVASDGDTRVLGSTANVEQAGGAVGAALYPLDESGTYRRVTASARGLVTFATAAARLGGARGDASRLSGDGALIDYAGPPGTLRTHSFADVLDGRVPRSAFTDKVVVVGVTALSQQDFHRTPAPEGAQMSGLEIQGNAIATILNGLPLRDARGLVDTLVVTLCALLGALAGRRLGPLGTLAAAAILICAVGVSAQVAFSAGVVTGVVTPWLAVTAAALSSTAAEQRIIRRDRARLAALVAQAAPGRDPARMVERIAGSGDGSVLHEGSRLGRYRIEEPIGVGAMGVVYRAHHERLDRPVAIKVLAPAVAEDGQIRERLHREALSAARLEHPGIVTVYDAGEIGGRAYIAMQLVEGRSLHDLIGTPDLSPPRIATIIEMVGEALDHAHARSVVHRDIKPANILVAETTGQALIADFGIASAAGLERLTTVGDLVGTVAYAAPEQLLGEDAHPSMDVYALGCVLFEMLTGLVPYPRQSLPAAIKAHLSEPPPMVSTARPDLAGTGLDEVIARGLAKDPAARWGSASALCAAAHAALQAIPDLPSARPDPSGAERTVAAATEIPGNND